MVVGFLLFLFSCQTSPIGAARDTGGVQQAITQQYQNLRQAMLDGNPSRIAEEIYTADGALFNPTGDPVQGREALEKAFAGMIGAGFVLVCQPMEVIATSSMAYEIGTASIQNEEGKELSRARYLVIWKEENGTWKMHRDFIQSR